MKLHFVDKPTNSNILLDLLEEQLQLCIFNYFNMNSNLMKLQSTAFQV